jgi:hypothetical protein
MEAIKKFGLGPHTNALLLVKLQPTEGDNQPSKEELDQAAQTLVDGKLVKLDDHLGKSIVNWKELRKLYKLNDDPIMKELAEQSKRTASDVEWHAMIDQLVTATVALKSVAA